MSAQTPDVLTSMAHGAAIAVFDGRMTTTHLCDFVAAMKGERGPVAASYYAVIVASRLSDGKRDLFLAELALRLIS